MIICVCNNISESEIEDAIRQGLNNMHLLREHLDLGSDCGKCKSCTKKILRECTPHKENYPTKHHNVIQFRRLAA